MSVSIQTKSTEQVVLTDEYCDELERALSQSWKKIMAFWPLKNLIAVNPLQGFDHLPFDEALKEADSHFNLPLLPEWMLSVNRETIKWLQAFFDEGQATLAMPLRHLGLFDAVYQLLQHDKKYALKNIKALISTVDTSSPERMRQIIKNCLSYLNIPINDWTDYLTFLLTSLPGWASYIQYKNSWEKTPDAITYDYQSAYIALRLVFVCLHFPLGKIDLIQKKPHDDSSTFYNNTLDEIQTLEIRYKKNLLSAISSNISRKATETSALKGQFVFCIDVRSEIMRNMIEKEEGYETFGFAGFFGLPIKIHNAITAEEYSACPVLLQPQHRIVANENNVIGIKKFNRKVFFAKIYQSLKYNPVTSFTLAESFGLISAIKMIARTFLPQFAYQTHEHFFTHTQETLLSHTIDTIPFNDQCTYAINFLRMIGLVNHFAPVIVLCGHGSNTQNNALSSSLECGACGGREGSFNALIFSFMLNKKEIREYLCNEGIVIPEKTQFIAAKHDTTTQEIRLLDEMLDETLHVHLSELKQDLSHLMPNSRHEKSPSALMRLKKSRDWSETRPEWGLARNASFIVGPRKITQYLDLEGRAFLHSYDWALDKEGKLLTTILTAPMIVAHWINTQYLFSSLNNVSFGAGSKVSKNITGKIGIMQGNASDLMHGLALQSVFTDDNTAYHEPLRLLSVIYAPRVLIEKVIAEQEILQKLFSGQWIHLVCLDPLNHQYYTLNSSLAWEAYNDEGSSKK
jgi:uncharacterized protein